MRGPRLASERVTEHRRHPKQFQLMLPLGTEDQKFQMQDVTNGFDKN